MTMNHQNPPIQILKDKELYVFDMDGTIYLGKIVFDFAIRFIENLRAAGKRVLFFTNNASRSTDVYLEKLTRLGFSPTAEEIMSSANVTVAYLNTYHKDQTVYLIGTKQLESQFRAGGIRLATKKKKKVDVVVSSFDTELTFKKLDDCSRLLTRGVTFIATNPDWVCPTAYGYVPDCGSVCEMLFRATGKRPRFIGKPQPDMVYMALEKTGCKKEEAMLVGDRLYTDVACALNAGIDSAFVLSGEGTLKDIEETGVEPTFIFDDVGQIAALL